jgi:hypothetical protein
MNIAFDMQLIILSASTGTTLVNRCKVEMQMIRICRLHGGGRLGNVGELDPSGGARRRIWRPVTAQPHP